MFTFIFGCDCEKRKSERDKKVDKMHEFHRENCKRAIIDAARRGEVLMSYHGGGINNGDVTVKTVKMQR